ncbi:NUDIX domain-containing protein [Angustibacter aerolatus]|uniref:MutT/NUDIX-like protein n=1 Tax=Angustibacter aerolatus TaxID=1162965 RepID=A0ABQ6JL22_9ACTN|nr:NUDIX domain-containing protein [Angustibacter aerolatus]GMA87490.1 putative MutT/NUDIX-like protein [Angustibacter aerolatus]
MGRREYVDDPSAPHPNRIVPAATAFVQDEQDRVLMIQRSDNGLWALPGGTQDLGESIRTTAEREVFEETGYRVEVTDIIGVYSDPGHVIAYDDGEVRQQFAISLRADLRGGSLATSAESTSVRWVPLNELADADVSAATRMRLDHALSRSTPYIG